VFPAWTVATGLVVVLLAAILYVARLRPLAPSDAEAVAFEALSRDETILLYNRNETLFCSPLGGIRRRMPGFGNQLAVSPDGRRLCVQRSMTDPTLSVCGLDGSDPRDVARNVNDPHWIDDRRILYVWCAPHDGRSYRSAWIVDVDTGRSRKAFDFSRITEGGYGGVTLSPDRKHLAAFLENGANTASKDVHTCDLQGGDVRTVWEDPGNDVADTGGVYLPDGRIVWSRYTEAGNYIYELALVAMRPSDRRWRVLVPARPSQSALAASPDGKYILIQRGVTEPGPLGQYVQLWMMTSDGRYVRRFLDHNFNNPPGVGACWARMAAPM